MHKRRLIQFALAGLAGLTIHPLAAAAASQAADEDLPLLVAGSERIDRQSGENGKCKLDKTAVVHVIYFF